MKTVGLNTVDDEETEKNLKDSQDQLSSEESENEEDDFLPYDLTEPVLNNHESKQYYYIVEPLSDLSDQDIFVRLQAWKGLVALCKKEDIQCNAKDVEKVLSVILDFDAIQGDEDFWKEFVVTVSILLYRNIQSGMNVFFQYIKDNSRSNMTISKCSYLLQALLNAATMLSEGKMVIKQHEDLQESVQEKADIVFSPVNQQEDSNGMIRVAKTKYRASYYKKQIDRSNQSNQSNRSNQSNQSNQTRSTKNQFTENASLFLNCLLTWMIRFPPRNTTSISHLLIALSSICKLPILHNTFDANFPDIAKVLLRYRYHKESNIRRNCLELFIATTKYEHRECIDKNCEEIQVQEKIKDWMTFICMNDSDDICRILAKSILSQLS